MMETYDTILKRMQDEFQSLSGYSADDASDIGIRLKVLAGEIFSIQTYADWLKRQMFPQTAGGEQLDFHAQQRGLARKAAQKAEGLLLFSTEKEAETDLYIPQGCVCSTQGKDPVRFVTTQGGIIKKGNKTLYLYAQAVQAGGVANVLKDTVTVIVTPPAGINKVTNPSAMEGGMDAEGDDTLRRRILAHIREVPNGTNRAYYQNAAESFEGVYSANVVPKGRGAGTVDIYLAGRAAPAESGLVARVQEYMNKVREVNVDVKVQAAQTASASIYVQVAVRDGYDFGEVSGQCKEAVQSFFNTLSVGQDVRLSDVGEALFHVPGVSCYRFDDYYTSDSTALPYQLYVLKDIVITQWEDEA